MTRVNQELRKRPIQTAMAPGPLISAQPKPNTQAAISSLDFVSQHGGAVTELYADGHQNHLKMLTSSFSAPPLSKPILSCRNSSFTSPSSSDYSNQSRGGLSRFFSSVLPPSKGGSVRIKGDEFIHMTKVLRLAVDDRVELFDGKGGLVEGCIQHVERGGLDVVALEDPRIVLPQNTQWHVFAALGTLKGGRADWLLEKCTELGACSVTPLLTERSPSISENRMDRLERVILAASKQCQRLHEMALNPPLQVTGFLPIVAKSEMPLIAIAGADPVMNTFALLKGRITSGVIIIGPEGDFTEMEVNVLTKAGAISVGLGPLRLRVETATVALLSTAMLWSDSQHATT